MNLNVEHRHGRQAVLHAMPVGALVERCKDPEFRAGEQQVGIHRIFADDVHGAGFRWNPAGDLGKRVAEIPGQVNVDGEIAGAVVVKSDIRGAGIGARGLDAAHVAHLGQAHDVGDHVGPGLAIVARQLHVAVIGAGPQHAGLHGRFGNHGDTRPLSHAVIARERGARAVHYLAENGQLVAVRSGSEILAQAGPVIAAVGGLEQVVAAVVDGFRIVRRNHQRRIPLKAVARRLVVIFLRPDALRFVGLQIAPREAAVLRFRVDEVRVGGIDAVVETIAALHRNPVGIANSGGLQGGTGPAPGVVVLQAAADVVGFLVIEGHLIELAERDVVEVFPIAPAVPGGPDAAIVAVEQVVGIGGIDPDGMHVAVDVAEAGLRKCAAAILGHIDVDAAEPDLLIVVGIDAELAEIRRARVGVAHAGPGGAAVFGAVDASERGVLNQRVHDVGILAIDFHGATAPIARGQATARLAGGAELGPVQTAVGGSVQAAAGTAAVVTEHRAPALIGAGKQDVGALRIDGYIGDAGIFVDDERLFPGSAAVFAHENAALLIGAPQVTLRGDVDRVGIGGVHHDAADVVRLLKAQMRPRHAGVGRLVDAITPGRTLAVVGLAGAHVDNGGVGRRDGDVADGRIGLIFEQRLPCGAAVDGLEEAAAGRADINDAGVGLDYGDVVGAPTHDGGADAAEAQVFQRGLIRRLRECGSGQRRKRQCGGEDGDARQFS